MKSVLFLLFLFFVNLASAQPRPDTILDSNTHPIVGGLGIPRFPPTLKKFKKHAVVMLAINYSPGEIEAVRKAALSRGEEFVLLPDLSGDAGKIAKMEYDRETYQHRVVVPMGQSLTKQKDPNKI